MVESNRAEAETLARGLRRHGHEVLSVDTGVVALQAHEEADIVLLDLELPDLDGLEVCRGIRSACDTPVIAVTARGAELDRVLGLQAGADDYLVKPYGFRELLARMDAVMRRIRPRTRVARTICHGSLEIDVNARQVRLAGRPVDMTRKEFDLLFLLASNPDTVIPASASWWRSGATRGRDGRSTHVATLRNKLGASSWVITVRGIGFRLGHG
ncbi:response regulator transcription factor [Luedemannella flava]